MSRITFTLALIIVLSMMIDASQFYNQQTAFLFEHETQTVLHFIVFFLLTIFSKRPLLIIVLGVLIEFSQIVIPYRNFEAIDLLSNILGCLVAKEFFDFKLKTLINQLFIKK